MKKRKYKAVIFDVDGTLLDTTDGILAAVRYTIEKHGLNVLSQEQMLSFIGPPIQKSFREHYGIENVFELQKLATTFRDRYKSYELLKAIPYNGIYQLCDSLLKQHIKIAIATYKRQDYAIDLLTHFEFVKYSNILFGADHENRLTKTDIIIKCLNSLNIEDYNDAVMIGDSENDAIGAEEAGIDFIGVTYGFGFKTKAEVMRYHAAIGSVEYPLDILGFLKMGDMI